MSDTRLDQMIEFAVDCICDTRCNLSVLAAEIATQWPDAPALEVTVALASAAESVQAVLKMQCPSGIRAQEVWRHAALVASEVHYLAVLGQPHATASDLLAHWAREKGPE